MNYSTLNMLLLSHYLVVVIVVVLLLLVDAEALTTTTKKRSKLSDTKVLSSSRNTVNNNNNKNNKKIKEKKKEKSSRAVELFHLQQQKLQSSTRQQQQQQQEGHHHVGKGQQQQQHHYQEVSKKSLVKQQQQLHPYHQQQQDKEQDDYKYYISKRYNISLDSLKYMTIHPPDLSQLDTNNKNINKNMYEMELCGTSWQEEYSQLHSYTSKIIKSISSDKWSIDMLKKNNIRVFIYLSREGKLGKLKSGGVADRFSLISMFAMCLIYQTAFFIDYPGLNHAFESGYGGLSWNIDVDGYINQYGFHNVVLNFPDLFGERNDYHCYNGTKGKICRNYGLDKHIANSTLTIARTARGKITSMFKEDYYINKFQQLNLTHGK